MQGKSSFERRSASPTFHDLYNSLTSINNGRPQPETRSQRLRGRLGHCYDLARNNDRNGRSHESRNIVSAPGPLRFDPIEEARRQWVIHGWERASGGVALIASVMRVQQIYLAQVDKVLRPLNLSLARFEILSVLSFSRGGSLPMNKISVRLQVHPTSTTSATDRLEAQGFVRRLPHESDRRTILVEILPAGRRILNKVTKALNEKVFAEPGLSAADAEKFIELMRKIRFAEGDFEI